MRPCRVARHAAAAILMGQLVVAASGRSHAAEMYSPPLDFPDQDILICSVLYTGSREREVTIQLFENGTDMFLETTATVSPEVRTAVLSSEDDGGCPGGACQNAFCRFIVEGAAAPYRALACVFLGIDSGGTCAAAE
jgi:hypothetical protein